MCVYTYYINDFIICFLIVTDFIVMAPRRDAQKILPEVVWIKTLRSENRVGLGF